MKGMGGDQKIGTCFGTLIVCFIHYCPSFRPSPSHLCFMFVLLATITWVCSGGMVDMACVGYGQVVLVWSSAMS